LQRKLER